MMCIKNKLVCTMILLTVLLLAGCSQNAVDVGEDTVTSSEKINVGIVLKAIDTEFWLSVKEGAERAAEEEGVNLVVLAPDKETNVEMQFLILNNLIDQKVDAIGVAPCNSKTITPIIERAQESGIVVFTLDTDAEAEVVSFVGTDNVKGGVLGAQRMAEVLGGQGQVALMTGVVTQQTHQDRIQGFKKTLEELNIEIVVEGVADSATEPGMIVMDDMIEAHPDIDGVFCTSATMALGAMETINARGLSGQIKVIAFDSQTEVLNAIKEGKIDSVVSQNPYNMGYLTVKKIVEHMNGGTVEKWVDTGTELITIENVEEYMD